MEKEEKQYIQNIQTFCDKIDAPYPSKEAMKSSFLLNEMMIKRTAEKKNNRLLSIPEFVEHCLYEPELGYYMKSSIPFGEEGDFVTAPEISEHFGECIAHSLLSLLKEGETSIYEFGGGTGRLAIQILKTLEKNNIILDTYTIIEKSKYLQVLQKQQIEKENLSTPIQWEDELKETSVNGVFIANEVLDAIPAHQFRWVQDTFEERCLIWQNEQWQFTWRRELSDELQSWLQQHQDKQQWQSDVLYEAGPRRCQWIHQLAAKLQRGVLLLMDYGYGAEEFFHQERCQGTFHCYYRHRKHSDFQYLLGLQDISAHVNFSEICFAAENAGLNLLGYTTQADFLMRHGILETHQENTKNDVIERTRYSQILQKLLMPSEMGELIKVIAFHKNIRENVQPLIPNTLDSRL